MRKGSVKKWPWPFSSYNRQQSTGFAAMQAKLDALTSANQELKELLKARTERSGIGLEDAIQMLQVLQGLGGVQEVNSMRML